MKTIYVGNLPNGSSADEIRQAFQAHGTVYSVQLINDWLTGRPRGFGFVRMNDANAMAAVDALDQSLFCGRSLRVSIAQDRDH